MGVGGIFRLGSLSETRFLFANVTKKSRPQMVPALSVLSLSCALLRRLFEHVCPMHPIMPWRYLQFDLAHTTTSVLRDSATTFTSSVSVRSAAFLLPSTGFLVPAQFNFRRSHVCCPKDNSYTLL